MINLPPKREEREVVLGVLAAAFLTLLLVTAIARWPSISIPLFSITIAPFALALAQRAQYHVVVGSAIFVTASLYRGVIYATQVNIAGIVITPLDLLWIYVVARFHLQRTMQRRLVISGYVVVAVAFFTALMGAIWGQPLYNIAKLLRAELFLGFGILIGASLQPSERIFVLKALVLGGIMTALQQVLTFIAVVVGGVNVWSYLGISASGSETFLVADRSATSSYRDNGVVINFASLALLTFFGFIGSKPRFLSVINMWIISVTLSAGILLSMTRSNWIALAIGVGLWIVISGAISRSRFWQVVVPCGLSSLAIIILGQITGVVSVLDVLWNRFTEFSTGGDGNTLGDRALETKSALEIAAQSPLLGVGAADVSFTHVAPSGMVNGVVRNQLHNGFLQYGLGGGSLALIAVVAVFILAIINTWIRAGKHGGLQRHTDRSLFLMVMTIALLSITTGLINDFQQSVVAGLILGMALSFTNGDQTDRGRPRFAWQEKKRGWI